MTSRSRLFVGNLPENLDENTLKAAFAYYGEIINLDVKSKSCDESNKKNFAFVTLAASNSNVESCIKNLSGQDFQGSQLYVSRARESFLERLQREREEEKTKKIEQPLPTTDPVLKINKNNPLKRELSSPPKVTTFKKNAPVVPVLRRDLKQVHSEPKEQFERNNKKDEKTFSNGPQKKKSFDENDKKKQDADHKRMESMRQKRQEFKEKRSIIKTSLIGIDKAPNKKLIFSDNEDTPSPKPYFDHTVEDTKSKYKQTKKKSSFLFADDDASGDDGDVNFDIKKQFEGKNGQKVLDLQSRYKSDKRFVLDERFIEEDQSEAVEAQDEDRVDLQQADEKAKQLDILQNVLGVTIRSHSSNDNNTNKKIKSNMGMLRFDPTQPEHAKFLAPVEAKLEVSKKSKKKKIKEDQPPPNEVTPQPEAPKIEVSKEKFYKVTDTLKEAIVQPTTFSLRSLFGANEDDHRKDEPMEQDDSSYIPLEAPKPAKVKNPLDRGEKNPFVYDSSDSEPEDDEKDELQGQQAPALEVKAVWKENLFFTNSDHRLTEGLSFFSKPTENENHKERRELKNLMKKRIYNKERKNQMFHKKIGGRKKTMKKSYNKNKGHNR